jgi:PIN domain nuclease of toxin-antitoxin system
VRPLLDAHALPWWTADDPRLPDLADVAISDLGNPAFLSAASAWGIATKYRSGKLPDAALRRSHKDPFDRMLIAQALLEDLALVSNEALFDAYGVRRVW